MALPLDITSKFRQLSSSMGLAVRKDAESDMPADLLMFENACGDTSPVMKTPASPVKANCSDVSLCSSDLHDFDSDSEDDEQNINRPWRPRPSPPFSGKGVVNKDGQGVGQMRQVGIGGGMKYFGCLKGVTKRLNVHRMGHKSIICIQGGGGLKCFTITEYFNPLPPQPLLLTTPKVNFTLVSICLLFSDCRYWAMIYFSLSNGNFRSHFALDSVWI